MKLPDLSKAITEGLSQLTVAEYVALGGSVWPGGIRVADLARLAGDKVREGIEAPCRHGTDGARDDPSVCSVCVGEADGAGVKFCPHGVGNCTVCDASAPRANSAGLGVGDLLYREPHPYSPEDGRITPPEPAPPAEGLPAVDMLTTAEVATLSRRTRKTIWNRVDLGKEPQPVRVGGRLLFPRNVVDAWLRGDSG
jgi:predicted DNA-binding transcriptional regulator AlpA